MAKVYTDFQTIETEVAEKAPPVIYKFRDWSNPYHQSILTNTELWFAHPKDLNDPFDVRTPVRFDFSEIYHPDFFSKLHYHAQRQHPSIPPHSRDFQVLCENKLELIRKDPQAHFEENYRSLRESDVYDRIGVLSFTGNPFNETMWAHYGNNGQGFCIGFDTIGLAKALKCGFGFVSYEEEPPLHSFIKTREENHQDQAFLKHAKWNYEEEFRFITFGVSADTDRAVRVDPSLIRKVIIGWKTPPEQIQAIKEILSTHYGGTIPLYRVHTGFNTYGLEEKAIPY
ncbi:MAG TPA: DUF2971 domain-containing protein [Flavisolibacter sp.]|nr:DUF2971 domain-containing protein [Flavisolibacter sp.]